MQQRRTTGVMESSCDWTAPPIETRREEEHTPSSIIVFNPYARWKGEGGAMATPRRTRRSVCAGLAVSSGLVALAAQAQGVSFEEARNFGVGTRPQTVVVGDFNGDGVQDLAVANAVSNNVSVLLGNGNGSFQEAQNFGVGEFPLFVAVGDFNGDGVQDLAVANHNSNNVSVLLGNGDGSFQGARNFDTGWSGPLFVAVGDFNGDLREDLVVVRGDSNDVS